VTAETSEDLLHGCEMAAGPPAHIAYAHRVLGWPGTALGADVICECAVYPVVQWSNLALHARQSLEIAPELDRPTLASWEAMPTNEMPPTVLSFVGFIADRGWRSSLSAVHALRGLGAGAIAVRTAASPLHLAEADYYDLSVALVRHGTGQLLRAGRIGAVSTATRRVGTRYWEEYLFQRAIDSGLMPSRVTPVP
jgi:hypothetical protein